MAPASRPRPARALSEAERKRVLEVLHAPELVDRSPWSVYAALLDTGLYLCSVSTMYLILREAGEIKERRNQLNRPKYKKPELLATRPNEVFYCTNVYVYLTMIVRACDHGSRGPPRTN